MPCKPLNLKPTIREGDDCPSYYADAFKIKFLSTTCIKIKINRTAIVTSMTFCDKSEVASPLFSLQLIPWRSCDKYYAPNHLFVSQVLFLVLISKRLRRKKSKMTYRSDRGLNSGPLV